MAEQLPDRPSEGHPILTGLVALVGVTVVVGLILGFAVVAGSRVLGIGGDGGGSGSSSERSMYLPRPEKTPTESGPLVSLQPGESSGSSEPSSTPEPTESESPEFAISLSAGQVSVGPMERIDLTGTYPGGEGAILQVERFVAGSWTEFQVTASVSNETFSTYVQTGQTGINKFRVRDTDTGVRSNAVTVTVG
ncbi:MULTISPECIES: hypothetical protein [unclassified Nocardioides]|uniref:hypothetical protein n=1 Tax=unclassified Nocardioides TaxID=2615069 RepID=UPI0009F123CF|nr:MULTISPECIES: hypothetical protein [unclassified Nocardioides]GAW51677.1 uncharacterized protein (Precursor) [Nocardioides sp. PD653-B2]GAW55355.1 uncharacterized protein (Precursor) [Nocardioides sp. PD653]